MIRIELPALISKLNEQTKLALEQAASLCIEHQHREILFTHFLDTLLDNPLSDIRCLLEQENISHRQTKEVMAKDYHIGSFLDTYPVFSPLLVELLQDAWLLSSTELKQEQLRSGAIFLTALIHAERYFSSQLIEQFSRINRENMRTHFISRLKNSSETTAITSEKSVAQQNASSTYLAKYTLDFTLQAREQKLDPVFCREQEIELMIDILCRRRKNNPIVVGDAGVGKSAVVEGLAQRIVAEKVPEKLKNVLLLSLDLGVLQAGASVKGEFEKRLKGIINEIKQSATPIILFIDEAHTLIGAGNQEGGADAANLLKPALARGELCTIAATTWKEYKKYFEKDAALSRRFQLVKLEAPTPVQATIILRGLASHYETAHNVIITDQALTYASELSARYLSGSQLPDKAIDVLDTACARVSINLATEPTCITRLQSSIQTREIEIAQIKRTAQLGFSTNNERLALLEQENLADISQKASLEAKWQQQKQMAHAMMELRNKLLKTDELDINDHNALEDIRLELESQQQQWTDIPVKERLVHPYVDHNQIIQVITDWTGVPIDQMDTKELYKITHLTSLLQSNIKGQDLAIKTIHQRLLTSYADLRPASRPKGAFLLVGPSGVGKTETVIQIANELYGGKHFLTVINMSEYQEKHSLSRLIGSPPGYVGFGEGGILTEAIRKMPYSVVLLDEVEKAHRDILNLFYQAFDKGELADGEGRMIDCKNIVFFMTSNLGSQALVELSNQPQLLESRLYSDLTSFFQPALLARMQTVPYLPLSLTTLEEITRHKLAQLELKLTKNYGAALKICQSVIDEILLRVTRHESGARILETIIEGEILPAVSLEILNKLTKKEKISCVKLAAIENAFVNEIY